MVHEKTIGWRADFVDVVKNTKPLIVLPVCEHCNGEGVIDRDDFLQKCICKRDDWNDRSEDQ